MVIVAIPNDKQLKVLNDMKEFSHKSGYRYANPLDKIWLAHITLSSVSELPGFDYLNLKNEIEIVAKYYSPWKLDHFKLVNKLTKSSEQFDKESNWIAIDIRDKTLKSISIEINSILVKHNISNNEDYMKKIISSRSAQGESNDSFDWIDYMADHMNISNHTIPSKSKIAYHYAKDNLPISIEIDRIALYKDKDTKLWEVKLE